MPLGVRIMKKANAKKCCVIGGVIFGLIVYISSYITSFTIFTLIYGIGAGLVIGFIYMIPIAHGYKYFPKKKGTVSGIIIAGSGFGTFVFGIVAIKVINPFNVPV
jgi:OFA family oxalate/formate antiporter-like MFS transporter